MKIHPYKVRQRHVKTEEILEKINATSIDKRWKNGIRLDRFKKENSLYHIDFLVKRNYAPAKYSGNEPSSGITLGEGEDVGEETAACYNPDKSSLVVQYNYYGAKALAIQHYINAWINPSHTQKNTTGAVNFIPVMNRKVLDDIKRSGDITSLNYSFYVPPLSSQSGDSGDTWREHLQNSAEGLGGEIVVFAIKSKRMGNLSFDNIMERIYSILKADPRSAKVGYRPEGESRTEIIDLIKEKTAKEINIDRGSDKRLPLEARWNALKNSLEQWEKEGLF